jgi:acyl-coenzyme A thioesterase PaaI-like protein
MFSMLIGRTARYTGTIGARVESLEHGRCVVTMQDRARVRNHLKSVHAIALINLGELATGATVMYQVDGRGRGILKGIGMDYIKKARGTITATCETLVPDTPGKHDLKVEGVLTDSDGDVVARVHATWRIDIYA